MRIFVDIGHPAHVHYFKNFITEMMGRGHEFMISARDKEMAHYLLDSVGLPYIDRGTGNDTVAGKLVYLLLANAKLFPQALRFRPDVFLSFGSPYAAHVSTLLRRPHIAFDDTENARLGQWFYRPFTNAILSPEAFEPYFGKKHLKFRGYMELCHLHPHWFEADTDVVREQAGIDPNTPYTVMRFVSWNANHDIGRRGLSSDMKIRAVRAFERHGQVYITSEAPLPQELNRYRASFPSDLIHHVLAHARLVYGESATMASEAAVLGTPAIFVDDVGRGYTREQEARYGLVANFSAAPDQQEASIEKGVELLQADPKTFAQMRHAMLGDTIDVTALMIWFVENYPDSMEWYHDTSLRFGRNSKSGASSVSPDPA